MVTMVSLLGPAVLVYFLCLCLLTYLAAMTGSLMLVWTISIAGLSMLNFNVFIVILVR